MLDVELKLASQKPERESRKDVEVKGRTEVRLSLDQRAWYDPVIPGRMLGARDGFGEVEVGLAALLVSLGEDSPDSVAVRAEEGERAGASRKGGVVLPRKANSGEVKNGLHVQKGMSDSNDAGEDTRREGQSLFLDL